MSLFLSHCSGKIIAPPTAAVWQENSPLNAIPDQWSEKEADTGAPRLGTPSSMKQEVASEGGHSWKRTVIWGGGSGRFTEKQYCLIGRNKKGMVVLREHHQRLFELPAKAVGGPKDT